MDGVELNKSPIGIELNKSPLKYQPFIYLGLWERGLSCVLYVKTRFMMHPFSREKFIPTQASLNASLDQKVAHQWGWLWFHVHPWFSFAPWFMGYGFMTWHEDMACMECVFITPFSWWFLISHTWVFNLIWNEFNAHNSIRLNFHAIGKHLLNDRKYINMDCANL